jgi:hypothetical protein
VLGGTLRGCKAAAAAAQNQQIELSHAAFPSKAPFRRKRTALARRLARQWISRAASS